MRKFLPLLIIAMILIALPAYTLQESSRTRWLSGTFIDKDGNATKVSKIRADGYITGQFKGKDYRVNFSRLKRIETLDNNIFRVTNLKGQAFMMQEAHLVTDNDIADEFIYYFYDPISMQEKSQTFVWTHSHKSLKDLENKMESIIFNDDIGRLKFNLRTKELFPPHYVFDPVTAERLIWKNPVY